MFRKQILKRFLALILALLLFGAPTFLTGGSPAAAAAEGSQFNLFETVGNISGEFISATTEIIRENWDDGYFSSIVMKLGTSEMTVDGDKQETSFPAVMEDGELMLPIIDVASAAGMSAYVDETTGDITIETDGGDKIIDNSPDGGFSISSAPPDEIRVFDDGTVVQRMEGESAVTRLPLMSAADAEEELWMDVHIDGENITISKPYQLKQVILYMKNGAKLKNSHGAVQTATDGRGLYFLQYPTEALTKAAYEALLSDTEIQYVTLNKVAYAFALTDRWGSERISADLFKSYLQATNKTGTPLTVAVVDTGIEGGHPHFEGRVIAGYNFVDNNNNPYDAFGHGTHVSGTISDCTPPNVKIMPVKVLNDSGYGDELTISLGIRYAADNNARVINMSFGGTCDEDNCVVAQAVSYAVNKGTVSVAAAGNEARDTANICPANRENVITVAALDRWDVPASFSNYGASVDVAAPGVDIQSSVPGGGYSYSSGTSMAAPHVSAAVAMLALEYPAATPQELKTRVRSAVVDLGQPGWDSVFGAGAVDFRAFFGMVVPATSFYLTLSSITMETSMLSGPQRLNAVVSPTNATNKSVSYTSSNVNVAVYQDGMVFPKGPGTAVITGSMPGLPDRTCTVTVTESQNWIDFAASSYAGGNGTEGSPYLIATAEQLAKLAYDMRVGQKYFRDEYFKLTADINLAGRIWTPINYAQRNGSYIGYTGFQGIFDGDGHSISNMKVSVPTDRFWEPLGLFGMTGLDIFDYYTPKKTEIKNLAVLNSEVVTNHFQQVAMSGLLVGTAVGGGSISQCYSTGNSSGAGLIGSLNLDVKVRDCYSTANAGTAGLVGSNGGSYIYNSYAAGTASSAGCVGYHYTGQIINVRVPATVNSFSVINVPSGNGFMDTKVLGPIKNCYYLAGNPRGIGEDQDPSSTDVNPRDIGFFKDKSNYSNPIYWDGAYPWDFGSVWGIDENYNGGLPYLRVFREASTDADKLAAAMDNITWNLIKGTNDIPGNVTGDLAALPDTSLYGTAVSWSSSNLAVVSNTGAVTRPASGSGDAPVTLTARVSLNSLSGTVVFNLIVKERILVKREYTLAAAGNYHSFAIKTDGSLWAWGSNGMGQYGNGNYTDSRVPVHIMDGVVSVAAGCFHSLAIKSDGSLWAWGYNNYGQLGDGTTTNSTIPIKVLDDVVSVTAGMYYSLAIKSDGSLWAWGSNTNGQLGDGTTINSLVPLRVLNDVVSMAAGEHHSLAIRADGSLWAWGGNSYGELGNGTNIINLTPVRVLNDVVSVTAGNSHSLAIKTDGSLWAWGGGASLGDGTLTRQLLPIKIMDDAVAVEASLGHTIAIKSDRSLWAWGANAFGQLGDGTTTDQLLPVKTMDGAAFTSSSFLHSLAVKADGSLWAWGVNSNGQIGDGSQTNSLIPIQIMPAGSILPYDGTQPTIKAGDVLARATETITIPITVSDSPLLTSLEFKVNYDSSVLMLTGASLPAGSGFKFEMPPYLSSGALFCLVPDGIDEVDPNGVVLNLTFRVLDNVREGTYYIRLAELRASDAGDRTIAFTSILGSVTVISFMYGDFTGNGYVDGTDILWIQRYIAAGRDLSLMMQYFGQPENSAFYETAADFTNNGFVDGTDILWIQRYIACGRNVDVMIDIYNPTIDFRHLRPAPVIVTSGTKLSPAVAASSAAPYGAIVSDAPDGNVLTFTPSKTAVAAGESFDVVLSLETETLIAGIEFQLDYDDSAVRLDNVTYTADRLSGIWIPQLPRGISMNANSVNLQGDCNLATLRFTVLDDSRSVTIGLTSSSLRVTDESGGIIEYNIVPATVNDYDPTQDNLDIAAAKALIEAATYTDTQAHVGNIAQARSAVEGIIGGLALNGVTATIIDGAFTAAVAGTTGNPAGTDGSYKFTVNLNKGAGTQQTTIELTLHITATPAGGTETAVYITGPSAVTFNAGATAIYTVSVANAPNVNAVQLTLRVDGAFLEPKSAAGVGSFAIVGDVRWEDIGGGMYESEIILIGNGTGSFDVLQVELQLTGVLGTTQVELVDFKMAYDFKWISYEEGDMVAVTTIEKWYSIYDLNKDGVVDLLDISGAMMHYMAEYGDADWDIAKFADVNNDGVIDIEDIILIRANFT